MQIPVGMAPPDDKLVDPGSRGNCSGQTPYEPTGGAPPTSLLCPLHNVKARNAAIAELVEDLRPRLDAILRHFQIPPADRDDILQDALLLLVRRWDSLHAPAWWLRGTLANRCRLYWRAHRSPSGRFIQPVDDETLQLLAGTVPPPQATTPLRLALAPILRRLLPRQRVLLLANAAGHTPCQLGERTGYAADTIRGHLRRTVLQALGGRARRDAGCPGPGRDLD